jgi:hypothetical protein
MPQDIAKAEPPAAAKSDEQQTEPVASSEITVDHQSGSELTMVAKAEVEVKLEAAAEPKPEPLAKAVDSHPAPEPDPHRYSKPPRKCLRILPRRSRQPPPNPMNSRPNLWHPAR